MMRLKMQKTPVQIVFTVFVLVMLAMVQNSYAQGAPSPAGKVVFAMGTPHAVNASGVTRNLAKGDPIFSGDHLLTGRGRLQVSMVDGAFISVQPNSEYVLDTYNYDGKTDGTEQATYRLVKGGVRAVTGLIGRVNKDAYKVNTAVATIGIRGTGHNTRLCAGDCGGVKDGLYHNTWEGITYVVNDVDTAEVPAGQGVYVQSIDTPIVPLSQPSGVTAVALTKTEQAEEQQDEDQQEQDQSTLVAAGDQRTSTGDQVVLSSGSTPTEVISDLVIGGIHPDSEATNGIGTFGLDASVFKVPNSNDVIGVFGLDQDPDLTTPLLAFGTIDYNAALGGDDPTVVAELGPLLDQVDQATKDQFLSNPAQVAESNIMGDIGWGRWANGYFLATRADGDVFLQELVDNQSLHYIFGPDPGTIPTSGTAFYDFIGGTQSTSLSGATLGNGVTDGAIYVDFGLSTAGIRMKVDHNGSNYFVDGKLSVDTSGNGLTAVSVNATTTASGSACNPSCPTSIEGGFAGSAIAGHPANIGISYDVQESDPILGVAAFATDNVFSSAAIGITTYTYPYAGTTPSVAYGTDNSGLGYDVYLVKDSGGKYIGTVVSDTGSGYVNLATIDLFSLMDNNNTAMTSALSGVLNSLQGSVISDFMSNPAQVQETVSAGDVSLGRWGNGKILFADNYNPGYTMNMQNDQSYHFINGPDPGTLPSSGAAYYTFTAGTQSTTASGLANASGVAVGSGVTEGTIMVDFLTDDGSLDMSVLHGNTYHVTGPLILDATNNVLFDGGGTLASTTAAGSACNPDCVTYFYGGLLGPNDSTSGLPGNLGLYYEIHENDSTNSFTDPIMGVAAFGFDSSVGSVTQKPMVFVAVQPDFTSSPPTMADVTLGSNAILHFSSATGEVIGAIMTTYEYDSVTMMDQPYRAFGTVDLTAMQNSNDTAAQTELAPMVTAAGTSAVSDFQSNPASVADFYTDGNVGWGRWTNGKVLTYNEHYGAGEVATLTGNQSIHFIYGPDPGPIPTTGTATYNFVGGTKSTSVSGATIGNGVTNGSIGVNFGTSSASLSMTVDHGSMYAVSGPLTVDTANNEVFDAGSVIASGGTGACASSCATYIDGGFAGPTNTLGNPTYLGIEYDIQESDVITGVAGFSN